MMRTAQLLLLLAASVVAPAGARAGWVVQWQETTIKPNGDRLDPQPSTMSISKGMVRIVQPQTTSLLDYGKRTFTILNTDQAYFWSGTVDEYLQQMVKNRGASLHKHMGAQGDDLSLGQREIDPATLPPLTIEKTEETATIAGHATTKYEIKVEGELLQEIWLAEDLPVAKDLDPKQFVDFEYTLSRGMLGSSAEAFNALYRSEDYRKLLGRGYILKNVTHHVGGSYERLATEIRQQDVPASEFAVPESYRRVRLGDLLPAAAS
jgi:hypothetical protein